MRKNDEITGSGNARRANDVSEARRSLELAQRHLESRPEMALWFLADAGALIADRLLTEVERARLLDLDLETGCGFRSRPGLDDAMA